MIGIITCDTVMGEVAFKEEVNATLRTDRLGPRGRHLLMGVIGEHTAVIRGIVSAPSSHRCSAAPVGRQDSIAHIIGAIPRLQHKGTAATKGDSYWAAACDIVADAKFTRGRSDHNQLRLFRPEEEAAVVRGQRLRPGYTDADDGSDRTRQTMRASYFEEGDCTTSRTREVKTT